MWVVGTCSPLTSHRKRLKMKDILKCYHQLYLINKRISIKLRYLSSSTELLVLLVKRFNSLYYNELELDTQIQYYMEEQLVCEANSNLPIIIFFAGLSEVIYYLSLKIKRSVKNVIVKIYSTKSSIVELREQSYQKWYWNLL